MDLSFKLNKILKEYSSGGKKLAYKKYKKIYLQNDKNITLRFNLAVMQQELGLLDEAESNFKSLIINNSDIKPKINLYNLYKSKGLFEKAIDLITDIQTQKPNLSKINEDKAYLFYLLKNYKDSMNECYKILNTNNKNISALNTLGLCLFILKKYDQSNKILQEALYLDNENIQILNSLGRLNHDLRKSKEAEVFFEKAYKLNPEIFETINNMAGFFLEEGKYYKAIIFFQKAKVLNPHNTIVLNNLAKTYLCVDQISEAEIYCRKAISLDNKNEDFKKTLSIILLKKYDFENAWLYFDGRLNLLDFINKNTTLNYVKNKIPKNINIKKNKKILVIREQGVGDEILYGTMYSDLLNNFSNVKIECDERLLELFKNSFDKKNSERFIKLGYYSSDRNKINDFDYIIYAGSLGKYFRNNIKSFPKTPYIKKILNYKDVELDKIIKNSKNIKIGISWKSLKNRYSSEKSVQIKDFNNIIEIQNSTIFNLQYGNIKEELKSFLEECDHKIITLEKLDLFNNLSGIANLLTNLDYFVTVSNSTAHLAGALGVKTILIKPENHASFHYWNYENGKTPWYNSINIISKDNLKDKNFIEKLFRL